ncbi:MAG: hypothetical protein HQK83_20640 [Fibrobacteria bacterium]|nr:hypothetical protein [Fibrobacteria bacterium]
MGVAGAVRRLFAPDAIEVRAGDDSIALERYTIDIDTGIIDLGQIQLRSSAKVSGTIDRQNIPPDVNIYVQAYGTERAVKVGLDGTFSFEHIPPGNHVLRIISSDAEIGIADSNLIMAGPAEHQDIGTFLMPPDFWRDTAAVREILDSNGLQGVHTSLVSKEDMGRIVDLNLNQRAITVLPPIISSLRLHSLHINQNMLDSLPFELGFVYSLLQLYGDDNFIQRFSSNLFGLRQLEMLSLRGNRLDTIPPDFGKLDNLKMVDFGSNRIQSLPSTFDRLVNLKDLDVSNNLLTTLPASLVSLTGIDILMVDGNQLCSLSVELETWVDNFSVNPDWKDTQQCK